MLKNVCDQIPENKPGSLSLIALLSNPLQSSADHGEITCGEIIHELLCC